MSKQQLIARYLEVIRQSRTAFANRPENFTHTQLCLAFWRSKLLEAVRTERRLRAMGLTV
jgi:hypothetical protein